MRGAMAQEKSYTSQSATGNGQPVTRTGMHGMWAPVGGTIFMRHGTPGFGPLLTANAFGSMGRDIKFWNILLKQTRFAWAETELARPKASC